MSTIMDKLVAARQLHQLGKLDEAEHLYREIVQTDPTCGEAWYFLGGIAQQSGRHDLAISYFSTAVKLMPPSAAALSDLGTSLHAFGRLDDALSVLRQAILLAPQAEALHFNLGNVLKSFRDHAGAIASFQKAIELNPDFVEAYCNLAAVLQEEGKLAESLQVCGAAIQRSPRNPYLLTVVGNVFRKLDRLDDAAACFREALAIEPNFAESLTNLGAVAQAYGQLDEAVACYRRAIELQPNSAAALNNLGTALEQLGMFNDAWACINRAIEVDPNHAESHQSRAGILLRFGNFEHGWAEYEWRWKTEIMRPRTFAACDWQGEPLAGATILIHAEQGFGDTFQFIRYTALVKRLGATVIVECQKALIKIVATCPGIDRLIAQGDELPLFDFHIPLLSVPRILNTSLATIPLQVPYLSADSELIDLWHARLSEFRGFRIGINWRGRTSQGDHKRRDIQAEFFAPLAEIPGVDLICLQKDATLAELTAAGGSQQVFNPGDDFDRTHGSFMDTAAVMKNLDLVITSDTSVPHHGHRILFRGKIEDQPF